MLSTARQYMDHFLHLFYPHNCEGCGTDVLGDDHFLCARCLHRLPVTHFFEAPGNPAEKLFYGRLAVQHAGAAYYFTKDSLLQHLVIQLKYRDNREAARFLGRMMGHGLREASRFEGVDLVVPVPLHPKKAQLRGYNQAALICDGIHETWKRPVLPDALSRIRFTETQTQRNRISRAGNMDGVFVLPEPSLIRNKHILLVDDVITTGSTLEACGNAVLTAEGCRVSIAAAGYTV